MIKQIVSIAALAIFLASNSFGARNITVMDVKRGAGASSADVRLFQEKFIKTLKGMDELFEFVSKEDLDKAADKLGGCKDDKCFQSIAKEQGVALIVSIHLQKVRDDFSASYTVFDTEFGDNIFEYSDKLPGLIKGLSSAWLKQFVSQLEPLGYAVEEGDKGNVDEAAKATVILDDQLSGRLQKEMSPYLIVRSVVIPAGQILEIDPGVTILMGGKNTSIVAYGQIFVNGTAANPVVFKSAKKEPKAWDWDRIYIRGNARSYFNHCRLSHSNFGLCVENGNLMVSGCQFDKNSITAMYFRQADVRIEKTNVGKGHIMGLHIDAGSKVVIDSSSIKGCSRAIVCQAYSSTVLNGTRIENNDYGIAAYGKASVELTDALVTDNRVGIMSDVDIPKVRLLTIRGNDENVKKGTLKEFQGLFARPEMLTAVKVKEKALSMDTASFTGGFKASISRGESFAARYGLLGQVTAGMSYRTVTDLNGEVHAGTPAGEMPHQATYVPGIRPEMQLFMQSKVGDRELDFNFNVYGNYNSPRLQPNASEMGSESNLRNLEAYRNIQKIELLSLSASLPGHNLILGDFTENLSDLSVSSRQIRGVKYSGLLTLDDDRKGKAAVSFGQSGIPWPKGLKPDMLDSNTTPSRQEWLALATVSAPLQNNLKVGANVVFTRHVDDPILFPGVSFDSTSLYGADPKIGSLSWGINGSKEIGRGLTAYVEVAAGYGDTLSVDVDSSSTNSIAHTRDTLIHRPIDEKNIAGTAGLEYELDGFSGVAEYTRAENQFYTGGNPSMKPVVGALQKIRFTTGKMFEPKMLRCIVSSIDFSLGFDWERVGSEEIGIKADTAGEDGFVFFDSSKIQEELNKLSLPDFKYQPFENRFRGNLALRMPVKEFSIEPEFSYYIERKTLLKIDSVSSDLTLSVDDESVNVRATEYVDMERRLQTGLGLLWAPGFGTTLVSNIRIKLNFEGIFISDDNDGDVDPNKWSKNDGSQLRVKGSLSTRFWKRIINNKLEMSWKKKEKKERDENKVTVSVLDKMSYDIVPRKVQLGLNGYFNRDITDYVENDIPVSQTQKVYGLESELKLSVTTNMSINIKGGYEKGYDDSEGGSENYKTYFGGLTGNYLF
ncbi:MAG: right-handed parallel beta-helix repeat-containing protein [Fibrobacteres bacterium]|nr:right-handed parallel beta-helix repeat-containing protein [Fibrobacterota bacterium]